MRKQKDRTQTNDVATAEKYSDEITYKLHKWHIMIWPQGATAPLLKQNYQINWLWHLHSLQWHSNLPKGKIRFLLDNMKYTKEKTSQCSIYQAYEVLHEYIYICIYISTFLEKLFKVILFLIIPIDSIKYLVSYLFFTFCPTSSGRFFFWDCFESAKHKYWSFYAASTRKGCMMIKNGNYVYVARQIFVKPLCGKKDLQTQSWGRWRRERSDKKGTHKTTTNNAGCFLLRQNDNNLKFIATRPHMYLSLKFTMMWDIVKYVQMCIFPL